MTQQNKPTDKPRIGITIGDMNGIGPEVIIKALSDNRMLSHLTPVIYGSSRVLSFYKKQLSIEEFNYNQVRTKGQLLNKSVNVVNCWEEVLEITPGVPSKEAGRAALLSLKKCVEDLKEGLLDCVVTAPIDKNTIHSHEFPFRGHTEYFTKEFNTTESLMLMVGEDLKVGLVTDHVPLKEVPGHLTKDRLELKMRLLEMTLKKDFGILKPKIAILGLNPHAGDTGLIGTEEIDLINPVIEELKGKGKLIFGPYPADGFFGSGEYSKFDGVLAMYHDQGLIPFKCLAFSNGINYTGGLPIVRTSPDHGTAYGIAGKNIADETSMRQAIYVATQIIKNRNELDYR
jgi:4-hydroxythreonine-4-phosphate dehydrogenase